MSQAQRLTLPYPGPDLRLQYTDRIRHAPGAAILDSGGGLGPKARYDILSAWPHTTLTTSRNQTWIRRGDSVEVSEDDPFHLLAGLLGPLRRPHPDLPFSGGAIGYFAYDLGRRIERLPTLAEADIDLPELAVGLYDWALVIDHETRTVTLAADAALPTARWQALVDCFTSPAAELTGTFALNDNWRSNMSAEDYGRAFRRIQDYIRAGDCYQVNLAQRFQAGFHGDPYFAWKRLNSANRAPFSAFLATDQGAILSVSPERFLEVRDRRVATEPIKGTRPRDPDPERDAELADELRNSAKDRAENLMIVDLLRNDIGKTCAIGSVRVPELFGLYSFPAVHHLISTVTGRLAQEADALALLRGAFPGGSITGAPKIRAMEIIEELEPHRRSVYCGAIGYIGYNGDMDTNIAIRTLIAHRGQLYVWAGGGLVADSNESAEYQETFHKLGKILPVLTPRDDKVPE